MAELDALIFEYSHLKGFPREKDALHTLRKVSSLVKPIMRARNWKVGTLAEFYPEQQNLLGINQNRGQKICLRLRHPGDKNQFLPLEQVVDTMLHELSHNIFGPHDAKFHALWDQLRKEYEGLLSKGYTGEGFMSDGHRLGGRRIPRHEAARIARDAAEKRRTLTSGSGQRLGGAPVRAGTDIRKVIVEAIERRNTVLKGCGSDEKNDKEIKDLADSATRNGFKTKADEDEANERAIAQALWELVQEDQKKEYGADYIEATAANPTGNGGGEIGATQSSSSKVTNKTRPATTMPKASAAPKPPQQTSRPVSRLVSELSPQKQAVALKRARTEPAIPKSPIAPLEEVSQAGWTCPICTLHNPINFLCCDACTTERPEDITKKLAAVNNRPPVAPKQPSVKNSWQCTQCRTLMEDKWWTCSACGKMKESSA
ncbi:hypothetical protein BP5796_06810 [Coleophoma crateriformis]|uniref:Uncharacterized protein n=1 Tax=Coleophoma crateriformis TaxID=565419 RepID=A0A3D8RPL6_9HELO|nr:hypothetical protein BP5796_06810 [Coleophoma crateriformis]